MTMNSKTKMIDDGVSSVTRAGDCIRAIDLEISRLSPDEHVAVMAYLDTRYVLDAMGARHKVAGRV